MNTQDQIMDKTLAELAQEVLDRFEHRTRANGTAYWCLGEGSPAWMRDLCHDAHGEMLPDDHRYQFIHEAVSALAAGDDNGDTLEADCYTNDLTAWLHSRTDRYAYCDQAVEDGYGFTDTITLLSLGQLMEIREVFELVKAELEGRLDEV